MREVFSIGFLGCVGLDVEVRFGIELGRVRILELKVSEVYFFGRCLEEM